MGVVVAEDSVVLRDGLVRLLSARGHEVVAEVGTADALLPAVAEHLPDVAVVDVLPCCATSAAEPGLSR